MPFSQSSQLSTIIGFIEELQPSSMLDVGVGMGQYGFLARNNLENVNLFRIEGSHAELRPRDEWRVRIDGIEAFPAYLTPVHEYVYNRILIGDALERLPEIPDRSYDLVLAVDILEHFTPADGRKFLSELKRIAKRVALISTPKDFHEQEVEANPYENHRSHWSAGELSDEGYGEFLENSFSWIALHRAGTQAEASPPAGAAEAGRARWSVSVAGRADEADLLALFQRAFGHAMPPTQWRWKYAGLEAIGTMARRGAQAVAFYGGMPRDILLQGAPAKAVQIGDVMVDPAERGMLTRRGAFFRVAADFAQRWVGSGRAYALAFGFPSERHTRLGEKLALYERVDEILDATWPASAARGSVLHRARPLTADRLGVVDALWARMAAALGDVAVCARTGAHFRHRYLEHPTVAYLAFLVTHRLSGAPVGVVVLRDHGEAGLELIDAVAPPEALPSLVIVAQRVAARLGRDQVHAWLTPRAAASFRASGPALTPAGIPVPTIVWGASPDLDKLRGRWWLMGGDADSR